MLSRFALLNISDTIGQDPALKFAAAAFVALVALVALCGVVRQIFAVALYRYAAENDTSGPFHERDLRAPFTKRRDRQKSLYLRYRRARRTVSGREFCRATVGSRASTVGLALEQQRECRAGRGGALCVLD